MTTTKPVRLPPVRPVVVAGVQFAPIPNQIEENVERCVHYILRSAAECDAKLVVFPESITTGFNPAMPLSDFYDFLPKRIDRILEPIQAICRKLRVHCVFPTYERSTKKDVIYNSAFLIDSRGNNLGVYRKTHPFPTERLACGGWTTPGKTYPVFPTEIGVIGIHICYDGDFPEISRILAVKGAQIIARPSALLRSFEIWEGTNKMRAYENHVYHIAVNAIGCDAGGSHYFGHSMITSPIAQTLALARAGEDIIYAQLDPDPIRRVTYGSDAPMLFDHLQDRNTASYTRHLQTPAQSAFQPSRRIPITQPES